MNFEPTARKYGGMEFEPNIFRFFGDDNAKAFASELQRANYQTRHHADGMSEVITIIEAPKTSQTKRR